MYIQLGEPNRWAKGISFLTLFSKQLKPWFDRISVPQVLTVLLYLLWGDLAGHGSSPGHLGVSL